MMESVRLKSASYHLQQCLSPLPAAAASQELVLDTDEMARQEEEGGNWADHKVRSRGGDVGDRMAFSTEKEQQCEPVQELPGRRVHPMRVLDDQQR